MIMNGCMFFTAPVVDIMLIIAVSEV